MKIRNSLNVRHLSQAENFIRQIPLPSLQKVYLTALTHKKTLTQKLLQITDILTNS